MFGRKKKKKEALKSYNVDLSKYRFHVMPEQFLSSYQDKKKSGKKDSNDLHGNISPHSGAQGVEKTKIVGILIIVGGVVAIIVGAVFVYRLSFKSMPTSPTQEPKTTPQTAKKEPDEPALEQTRKEDSPEPQEGEEEAAADSTALPQEQKEEDEAKEEEVLLDDDSLADLMELGMAPDEDGDGLSDKEEALFGTNKELEDTDEDGYTDGQEIRNLYNPIGLGKLKETPLVKSASLSDEFEILYPYSWTLEKTEEEGLTIIRATTGEFFQILEQDNSNSLSIEDWFDTQNPGTNELDVTSKVYGRWNAVRSHDGLTAYLLHPMAPKTVLVVFYNPVDQDTLYYKTTFEMMLGSLSYVGKD